MARAASLRWSDRVKSGGTKQAPTNGYNPVHSVQTILETFVFRTGGPFCVGLTAIVGQGASGYSTSGDRTALAGCL
eukprot:7394596-Alexandrium_andersonii.AAC.1